MMDLTSSVMGVITDAIEQMSALTAWEAVGVVLAIAYLWLAMKGSVWCWPAALLSTAIYTLLFWEVSLLMESVLNVYYMLMAVYGYWLWTRGRGDDKGVEVISWSLSRHLLLIAICSLASLVVGYFMANYTSASYAYLDAATTCFAVMTTYLVAQKVLENWLYWVVIDLVSIYLYFSKGLMLTAMLFVLYVGMAIGGYVLWRRSMRAHSSTASGQLSFE
ncbi:nicotinamide riboside transporter PnuC [Shewanella sp. Isolate11]|uniref:nicotinamide riboside transporter PnuC n=1 Tax=Shewanella sp. Isolate11 TaxID=2908530 RepID=UPI001EFCDC67|nr:nicotinamide riboside transporter PnuC [Shewanella sp. Isolate11]MCG9696440.1 nicotinamide riboside transporter PnuC [Shewanella sp. Isolate11]